MDRVLDYQNTAERDKKNSEFLKEFSSAIAGKLLPAKINATFVQAFFNIAQNTRSTSRHLVIDTLSPAAALEVFKTTGLTDIGGGIAVNAAFSVFNPMSLNHFLIHMGILEKRILRFPQLFAKPPQVPQDQFAYAEMIHQAFLKKVQSHSWNFDIKFQRIKRGVSFVMVSTTLSTSALDFMEADPSLQLTLVSRAYALYDLGKYFACSVQYAASLLKTRKVKDPTLILCFIIPGTPYPMSEVSASHQLGSQAMHAGYQSHIARVDINGKPNDDPNRQGFLEIIVSQESQIWPVAVVELNEATLYGNQEQSVDV